ncbi:hypothetical protein EV127DRAFT_420978 [Xylaria flabelliformis]|nr:hypothetical protein EV127DRAFT_420978 [Xylaria flabelliformis]
MPGPFICSLSDKRYNALLLSLFLFLPLALLKRLYRRAICNVMSLAINVSQAPLFLVNPRRSVRPGGLAKGGQLVYH